MIGDQMIDGKKDEGDFVESEASYQSQPIIRSTSDPN